MKLALITKSFRFEAAHQLSEHRGKCVRLHGHSYRLDVTLRGPIKDDPKQSDHGMIMDFEKLSGIVKASVIEQLDHYNLNEVTDIYTTAENLVHWIWETLVSAGLPETILYRVRLWETDSCFAEITLNERE